MAAHHTVEAMRRAAKRRLPRFAFDYVDGGAGDETALGEARAAFVRRRMVPRILSGAELRDPRVTLLSRTYEAPFGIAPIGLANLVGAGTDLGLATAARAANLPYVLSTAGTTAIEAIAEAAPNSWFQLYVGRDPLIVDDLIRRASVARIGVLVVTADAPTPGKRVRDLVNGFTLPLKPSPAMAWDVATHPGWSWSMLKHGAPRFANLDAYGEAGAGAQGLAQLMAAQSSARLDWALLADIRRRWLGKLLVKGVLHPDDAVRLADLGVDGLIVSNHGGRQLNGAIAPLDALPAVRSAVGPFLPLILDGGVRTGEDIAMALALGADMTLLGRPFLFAAAARGPDRGPAELIALLRDEFDRALGQLGCRTPADLKRVGVTHPPAGLSHPPAIERSSEPGWAGAEAGRPPSSH